MRILQQNNAVLLIDLSNVAARAVGAAGEDGFLELFCRMLQKIRRRYPNHRFVFAVEGAGTLRRQRVVPEYKGGRVPSPEFQNARNTAMKLVRLLDCRMVKAPDGEADDAIAVYCRLHPDDAIVVLSDDRDLWQLITTNIQVESRVKGSVMLVDRFACRRLLGVEPAAIPMMKALLGDKSDSIPRAVERVQQKKLLRLAQAAEGSVDQLYAAAQDADWLTDNDRKKLAAAQDAVKQHLRITRVWADLTLKTKRHHYDAEALEAFLQQHGLAREGLLW